MAKIKQKKEENLYDIGINNVQQLEKEIIHPCKSSSNTARNNAVLNKRYTVFILCKCVRKPSLEVICSGMERKS